MPRPHRPTRPKAAPPTRRRGLSRSGQATKRLEATDGGGRVVALWKPFGVLSQFTGAPEPQTLAQFGLPKGLYPVGRLDKDSEGLLLLSDDGRFIDRLLDPKHGHPRTYWAQVERIPDDAALQMLRDGITLKDGPTRPARARRLEAPPALPPRDPPIRYRKSVPDAWIELTLTEGRNRQVRRMTAAVGHPTLRLVRVAIASLSLFDLDLAPGQWRAVRASDVLNSTAD